MRGFGRLSLVPLLIACHPQGGRGSDDAEVHPLRAVNDAYRAAWLAGDSAAVLRLFAPDAVLLPHHGDPPVVGLEAIRRYWWPPNTNPATVTALEITVDDADVDGDTGTLWGRGEWRITHRMWDDPVAQPD